jgi:hypothetical protein
MRELQEQGKCSFPATIENLEPTFEMREPTADTSLSYAVALLNHYGFELRGYTAEELINLWVKNYSAHWVRLAVIEALYQGRYKAVSVEQILTVWARRGQPIHRFNHEFERLISRKLPQKLTASLEERSRSGQDSVIIEPPQELAVTSPLDLGSDCLRRRPSDDDEEGSVSALGQLEQASAVAVQGESSLAEPISFKRLLKASAPDPALDTSLPPVTPSFPSTTVESVAEKATSAVQAEGVLPTAMPTAELPDALIQSHDARKAERTDISIRSTYDANWSRCEISKQPIHQFTPPPDSSDFYLKLKAVIQQQEQTPATIGKLISEEQTEGQLS